MGGTFRVDAEGEFLQGERAAEGSFEGYHSHEKVGESSGDFGGDVVGRNPSGGAELPRVVGSFGVPQLSQAGLLRAIFSGRKLTVLGWLFGAISRGGTGELESGSGYDP